MLSSIVAAAVFFAGAYATTYDNSTVSVTPIYTTEVLTAFTTYCPEPTSIVHNNVTYTITTVYVNCARQLRIYN